MNDTTPTPTPAKAPDLYSSTVSSIRLGQRTALIIRQNNVAGGYTFSGRCVIARTFEGIGQVDPSLSDMIVVAMTAREAGLPIPPNFDLLLAEWDEHRAKTDAAFRPRLLSRFMVPALAEAELAKRNANLARR